ncbi:hypothetical protein BH24ACT22_BH24ACT22_11720 [soil metagenome]
MRRIGEPMLLKFSMLLAALSLATAIAISIATPLHSEPGGEVEEVRYSEPAAIERPIAAAKGTQSSRPPNIRPESAVSPEIRILEQKEIRQQEAARRKLAQQELKQQKAEQRKLEQQKAAQLRAEQQRIEQQKAAQQKAERQEAERRAAEKQRAEQRKAKAQQEKAEASSAVRRELPQPAEGVRVARSKSDQSARTGSGNRARPPAPRGGRMALSIESIGLRNSKIETTEEQQALDQGLTHLPQTSRPWERGSSRNVYVVGHRVGWPNTGSWKIFYRLDELQQNDELVLTAGGETYRYKVTEKFVVTPWDVWVTDPVKGRDLLTLQTCTGPDFSQRLIIRADRV